MSISETPVKILILKETSEPSLEALDRPLLFQEDPSCYPELY